jgi:hypothetical protein
MRSPRSSGEPSRSDFSEGYAAKRHRGRLCQNVSLLAQLPVLAPQRFSFSRSMLLGIAVYTLCRQFAALTALSLGISDGVLFIWFIETGRI